MITIQPKVVEDEGVMHFEPATEIPEGSRTRFHNGVYECISDSEDWPDEVPEPPPDA